MSIENKVAERDDRCCVRCGKYAKGGSIHHRKLRSQGGLDTFPNLVLLDGSGSTGCHGWVHENRTEAAALGFIVPSYEDPATIPVQVYGHGRVYLDELGNYLPVHGSDPYNGAPR